MFRRNELVWALSSLLGVTVGCSSSKTDGLGTPSADGADAATAPPAAVDASRPSAEDGGGPPESGQPHPDAVDASVPGSKVLDQHGISELATSRHEHEP